MTNIFSIGKTVEFVSPQSSSTPVYEEVDVMRDGKCSQDIQLMSNEAYRPIMGGATFQHHQTVHMDK